MNEPNTPSPNLEHVSSDDYSQTQQASNAQISQSINPASQQQPTAHTTQSNQTTDAAAAQLMPPATTPQPAAQPVAAENQRKLTKSVLIIEDERFIYELYTRALQKEGYRVETQSDGRAALDVARAHRFDIILLDIMLPSMNGVDLLYALKDKSTPGGTVSSKIIITTNMDQPEETKTRVEQLADGYLIKAEVTPKELVNYISQL